MDTAIVNTTKPKKEIIGTQKPNPGREQFPLASGAYFPDDGSLPLEAFMIMGIGIS